MDKKIEQKMKKTIIITSIFQSTKSVNAFSNLRDFDVIVIGDRKSPEKYNNDKVEFLSVKNQINLNYSLANELPFNHYCRKNIGYIYAIKNGSDLIIDTDDDNVPYEDWGFPEFEGLFDCSEENFGFVNVYSLFTKQHIWPRGLPLKYIKKVNPLLKGGNINKKTIAIGVWQGLADDDPDVDAIYRLIDNSSCFFEKRAPVVLGKGTICPYNSQNSATRKELFPLLYLPSTVTFRFTDILRSLVAQPIMWLYDYQLGFTHATVIQERNPHDYSKDFISEIPCFIQSENVVDIVLSSISASKDIKDNFFQAYLSLSRNNIVTEKELPLVESWLKDISI
jgi:hypothetical protein